MIFKKNKKNGQKLFAKIAFRRRFLPSDPDGFFTFEIPEKWRDEIKTGQIVVAPLQKSFERGLVAAISAETPRFSTREIAEIATPPLLEKWQFSLAREISKRIFCPVARIFPLFLPAKIWAGNGKNPPKIFVKKTKNPDEKIGKKMAEVLSFLEKNGETPRENLPFEKAVLDRLLKKKAIQFLEKKPEFPEIKKVEIPLDADKKPILEKLKSESVALLFGRTGSGKSHLLRALAAEIVREKKTAIFVVPEIGLSEDFVEKLREVFGEKAVGIFHSRLSEGEKARAFWAAKNAEKAVFVVSRAGIFLPFRRIGFLAIEEEHDSSFESDATPKIDAREIAEIIGKQKKVPVIFSSATPRFETFFAAKTGKMGFFKIASKRPPPRMGIVDLKNEFAAKNFSPISKKLLFKIREKIDADEKVFLFLNRRGFFRVVFCEKYGEVLRNPENGIALVAHQKDGKIFLMCHFSGKIFKMPKKCPQCGNEHFSMRGHGTAGVENVLKNYFPAEKIIRIDRDATAKKGAFSALKNEFERGGGKILVGTQIVGKGIDFKNIALVGILDADTGLHFPDFRAAEKVFQNIAQAAGRAGRREKPAEIILQTRLPELPIFHFLARNDFEGFFESEIKNRKAFFLPPFSKIQTICFRGKNREKLFEKARTEEKKWNDFLARQKIRGEVLLAPAIGKKNGFFVVEVKIIREN